MTDLPSARRRIDSFHDLFYDQRAWNGRTSWLGTSVYKSPLDLWVYQEIIVDLRPDLIIETGTYAGGSALYFASICDLIGHGHVLSVDLTPRDPPSHHRVEYLTGSSTDPSVIEAMRESSAGFSTVMAVLDSDHSRDHVLAELRAYGELVTPGSYMVVEDTNVNGHPVRSDFGPGPMEAVEIFLADNPEFEADLSREKFLVTFSPKGWLRKRPRG